MNKIKFFGVTWPTFYDNSMCKIKQNLADTHFKTETPAHVSQANLATSCAEKIFHRNSVTLHLIFIHRHSKIPPHYCSAQETGTMHVCEISLRITQNAAAQYLSCLLFR